MHIKYIWQAYRNKATYEGGEGDIEMLWNRITFPSLLRQLVIITAPSVPDLENVGQIRIIGSVPDTYNYLWAFDIEVIIFVVLKCKKIQKCI
jgi:hypothetical protein